MPVKTQTSVATTNKISLVPDNKSYYGSSHERQITFTWLKEQKTLTIQVNSTSYPTITIFRSELPELLEILQNIQDNWEGSI